MFSGRDLWFSWSNGDRISSFGHDCNSGQMAGTRVIDFSLELEHRGTFLAMIVLTV
jgi:hypothetical protein